MSDLRPYSGLSGPGLPAALAAGGWTRDVGPPATVRLTTVTDQVAIGTATPVAGREVTILTTGANQGIRVTTTGIADNVLDVLLSGEANPRWAMQGQGTMSWGPGGAGGIDTYLGRTSTGQLMLTDISGGTNPTFVSQGFGLGSLGLALYQWGAVYGSNLRVHAAGVDANPTAQLSSATLRLGLNSADALSTRLYCSANRTLILDDSAAGPIVLSVLGTTVTQGRRVANISKTFATAPLGTPYVIAATIETVYMNTAGGNCEATVPNAALAAQLGRRITIKKTTLDANTVALSSAGGNIEGAAPPYIIPGLTRGSITVESDGTDWWII